MEESSKELSANSKLVINQNYLQFFDSWAISASKPEKKGLKILSAVYKSEGKKTFKFKVQHKEKVLSSADELRKKYMRSSYTSEFCPELAPVEEPEIFKYRDLNEMEISKVLTPLALLFVNHWISLRDDPGYKNCVFAFLKSFYSHCKVQIGGVSSTHRDFFRWTKPKNCGSSTVFLENKPENQRKRTGSLDLPSLKILPVIDRGDKIRAENERRGNGKIINWIALLKNPSVYQDSFVPFNYKRVLARKADFRTSIVTRLLPDS